MAVTFEGENDDNNDDVPPVPPLPRPDMRGGERRPSTDERLKHQGLKATASSRKMGHACFAIQSIRRNSSDWRELIRPFVADLAFRSVVKARSQSEVSFQTYTCHAAVLFVDLSSYSRITAAIAHRGAHFLSSVVNAYLSQILDVIDKHGGDCVKFAGDAVLVVWEGKKGDLEPNVLAAAACVLEMQETCASFPVEGTDLIFQTHCGLSCGRLESEVFRANSYVNMQRLFHSISGDVLTVIGELVDYAKSGQVAVDQATADLIGTKRGTFTKLEQDNALLLVKLDLSKEETLTVQEHVEDCLMDRRSRRNAGVEEDFIHNSVLKLLSHGGTNPTQIAQMRSLCVLFISMTSHGNWVNWLMEVQAILDRYRCPIVQILDDDKGVHIVAAINLYETAPYASVLGIQVCSELVYRQVGCAIGMAQGSTFCGVTGSSRIACRWDITGPPAVRAARLMQYAEQNGIQVAIDSSVYFDYSATAKLELLCDNVPLKGSPEPCQVYGLSNAKVFSAFRILETIHGRCHDTVVHEIKDVISKSKRSVVVVKGPIQSGKKIVCQRAAGLADFVPYLHRCEDGHHGLLQLALTIATWFLYCGSASLKESAKAVLDLMGSGRLSRAHDACVQLVNDALEEGISACFLVDRIQFIDPFSMSLIRECIRGPAVARTSSYLSQVSQKDISPAQDESGTARICFLCVHVTLYDWLSADQIVDELTRNSRDVHMFTVLEAQPDELRSMFRDVSDMEVEDRWLKVYGETSGYCAGYLMTRADSLRNLSGKLWKEGKPGYAITSECMTLGIPPGYIRMNREVHVMQVNNNLAMRFMRLFDELPPTFQVLLKVLYIASRKGFYELPCVVAWEVLNDLIAAGVEMEEMMVVVQEMKEMYLIKIDEQLGVDKKVMALRNPAIGEVALDECTPNQVRTISLALIERLEVIADSDFRVRLVLADLHIQLKQQDPILCISVAKSFWKDGYEAFLEESKDWPQSRVNMTKETIEDEIVGAGFDVHEVLGQDFSFPSVDKKSVGSFLPLVKIYSARKSTTLCTACYSSLSHRFSSSSHCLWSHGPFVVSNVPKYLSRTRFVPLRGT
jgi:class 3 adenylate cyclase